MRRSLVDLDVSLGLAAHQVETTHHRRRVTSVEAKAALTAGAASPSPIIPYLGSYFNLMYSMRENIYSLTLVGDHHMNNR